MSIYLGDTPIAVNSSSREIGEIIQSTIPLTDAGLHLLDGSLISGSGSYADFVTYMAGLVSSYSDCFCSEADWQTSVTNYGVCGKFVYDSVNNTVRLPKRTSEHGDLIKSYSSGASWYRIYSDGWCEQGGYIPEQTRNDYYPVTLLKSYIDTNYSLITNKWIVTNVTTSIAAYSFYTKNKTTSGFTTAVDPNVACSWQASGFIDVSDLELSPLYEYIVIANSVKTNIEVDIDEVATGLNGKADTDLSNVNSSGTSLASGWSMPSSRYIDLTLGASGSTYTAPANGWLYIAKQAGTTSNVYVSIESGKGSVRCVNGGLNVSLYAFLPMAKGNSANVYYSATGTTIFFKFIYAQGAESEA